MAKKSLSWEIAGDLAKKLAKKVSKEKFKPEILVGIIRGGLLPALVVSHELGNKELYAVKCIHYNDKKHKIAELVFQQDLPKNLCKGKKVLVIDEVADSGESLMLVKKILEKQKPKELKTAVLHEKPWSKIKPDYSVEKTKDWIVYPWEKN